MFDVMDVSAALLILVIIAATSVGRFNVARFKLPWITGAVCVLLAVSLVAQIQRPELLSIMERNAAEIRDGQLYRLFTALWVQDGGVAGGVFNLAMLAVVGTMAEQLLSRLGWLAIYFIGGVSSQIVALAWQPVGAGNSVAYMSLAGALLGIGVCWPVSRASALIGGLGLGAALLLCLRQDIHGAAVAIGCVLLLARRAASRLQGRA